MWWSQWPRGLRRRSTAAHYWDCGFESHRVHGCLSVCCKCCMLSGRGLCDELITRPEKSYRLWCVVVVCNLETSRMRRPWPAVGRSATGEITICTTTSQLNNSTFCTHSVLMCFVWISEQTATISLYSKDWELLITETSTVQSQPFKHHSG